MSWDDDVKTAAKELKRLSEVAEKYLGKLFESEDPEDKTDGGRYMTGNYPPSHAHTTSPNTWSQWGPGTSWYLSTTPAPLRKGQIVHYRSQGSLNGQYPQECRPAIVTRIHPHAIGSELDLCVIGDNGVFFKTGVAQDPSTAAEKFVGGAWHRDCGE